jgi:hypothetical protein
MCSASREVVGQKGVCFWRLGPTTGKQIPDMVRWVFVPHSPGHVLMTARLARSSLL